MAEQGFKMSALFGLIFRLANKYVELNAWQCLSLIKESCCGTLKVISHKKIVAPEEEHCKNLS